MNDTYEFGSQPQEFGNDPPEIAIPAQESALPSIEFAEARDSGPTDQSREFSTFSGVSDKGSKAGTATVSRSLKQVRSHLVSMLSGAAVATVVLMSTADPAGIVHRFLVEKEAVLLNETTILLNDDTQFEVGAIWSESQINLSQKTTIEFDYFMSERLDRVTTTGSDGFAVAFSDVPYSGDVGSGGELGYEGLAGVEFDTFGNGEFYSDYDGEDYAQDHVAVIGDAVWKHQIAVDVGELDDGEWHHISLTIESGVLSVCMDEYRLLDQVIPALDQSLYIGITGANGSGTAYKLISNMEIDRTPVQFSGPQMSDSSVQTILNALTGLGVPIPSSGSTARGDLQTPKGCGEEITEWEGSEDPGSMDDTFEEPIEEESEEADPEGTDTAGEGSSPKVCSTCNGHGFICPGSIAADDPEGCHGEMYVKCKACNQTGREADGSPCSWCKGTLTHLCPSFESHYDCPDCGGTGYVR